MAHATAVSCSFYFRNTVQHLVCGILLLQFVQICKASEASGACAGKLPQGRAPGILHIHLGKSSGMIHFQVVRMWRKTTSSRRDGSHSTARMYTIYTTGLFFHSKEEGKKVLNAFCFSALFSNCFGKGRQRLTCATCELKTCQVSSLASVNGAERLLLIWCVASSWVSKWFSVWSIKEMLGWVPSFDWNALILLDNEKMNPLSVPNSEMIWLDSMALYRHFWKKTNQSNRFWLY